MAACMQAPVVFELKESPTGGMGGLIVRAKNKNTFSSLANLLLSWRVLLDGVPLLVGDPAQRGLAGWYPGGSVAIAPLVPPPSLHHLSATVMLDEFTHAIIARSRGNSANVLISIKRWRHI